MRAAHEGDDDRQLVAAFLDGREEAAFRALYRRHTPRLYQLARRLMAGDDRDAEEAVQEAWIRAAGRLEAFAWRSSLGTWLTGITINVCRNLIRRRQARLQPVALEPSRTPKSTGPGPVGDQRIDLERAISLLPPKYRQVLVLHDVEGYTHREISTFLDIEIGTSKSQLFRARKAMRELLASGAPERQCDAGRPLIPRA